MKALMCKAFGPLEDLAVEDVTDPTPGPRQLRVDVKAAGLNFPDALTVLGKYQVKPPLPFAPGVEMAGVVSAVGPEVRRFAVGDRVLANGLGGFAEECVVDEDRTMPLPDGMDFELGAAFVLTYGTSLHGLKDCGRLQPGETLLVLGAAGGVGVAAVEIGKALGATVIAAASSDEKLELCRRLGADATINYATTDLRAGIEAVVGKKGVDVVYDPVGGPYTEPALRSMAWGGRLLVIGFAAGEIPKIAINHLLLRERSLVGVYWGDSVRVNPPQHLANMKQLMQWFAEGKVRPVVSERVPLARTAEAMQHLMQRKVMGKVVILPEA